MDMIHPQILGSRNQIWIALNCYKNSLPAKATEFCVSVNCKFCVKKHRTLFSFSFTAARNSNDGVKYFLKFSDGWKPETISSERAKLLWPQLTMNFLEEHVCFIRLENPPLIPGFNDGANVFGQPLRVWCKQKFKILFPSNDKIYHKQPN